MKETSIDYSVLNSKEVSDTVKDLINTIKGNKDLLITKPEEISINKLNSSNMVNSSKNPIIIKAPLKNIEESKIITRKVIGSAPQKLEGADSEGSTNKEKFGSFLENLLKMSEDVDLEKISDAHLKNLFKFLKGTETYSRPIYFSRHGQSIYNTKELIGGDSLLSENGLKYGK